MSNMIIGSGCHECPVHRCPTMSYRGSACAAERAKLGLGDPMTNADRMVAMIQNEDASGLLSLMEGIFEDGVPGVDYMRRWLRRPAEEESNA